MRTTGEFCLSKLGRPALNGPGGDLDWQRTSDVGQGDVEREQYLRWVAEGAGP